MEPATSDPLDGLVTRVARGERSALAGLHDALAPDVLRTIRGRLPDAAESMSVLRATFVEVWRLARYHTGGAVRGWVTGVADRRAVEHVRGSTHHVGRGAHWPDIVATHEAHTDLEFGRLLGTRRDVGMPAQPSPGVDRKGRAR